MKTRGILTADTLSDVGSFSLPLRRADSGHVTADTQPGYDAAFRCASFPPYRSHAARRQSGRQPSFRFGVLAGRPCGWSRRPPHPGGRRARKPRQGAPHAVQFRQGRLPEHPTGSAQGMAAHQRPGRLRRRQHSGLQYPQVPRPAGGQYRARPPCAALRPGGIRTGRRQRVFLFSTRQHPRPALSPRARVSGGLSPGPMAPVDLPRGRSASGPGAFSHPGAQAVWCCATACAVRRICRPCVCACGLCWPAAPCTPLTRANPQARFAAVLLPGGFSVQPYASLPPLYFQVQGASAQGQSNADGQGAGAGFTPARLVPRGGIFSGGGTRLPSQRRSSHAGISGNFPAGSGRRGPRSTFGRHCPHTDDLAAL